jgi:hypothetical protein
MKLIDTKTHGYLDYIMGIFLIASPSLFSLDMKEMQSYFFYASGATVLVYSLLTDYEAGLIKIIPMKIHLILDILSGVLLASSPWLFDFCHIVYGPHLVLGLIEIAAALVTRSKTTIEIKA